MDQQKDLRKVPLVSLHRKVYFRILAAVTVATLNLMPYLCQEFCEQEQPAMQKVYGLEDL